jgi:hypothetical protein
LSSRIRLIRHRGGTSHLNTMNYFLNHRRRIEIAAVVLILLLFAATNASTEVIENIRDGDAADWSGAWARELSSAFALLILVPLLAITVERLELRIASLRQRLLWHIPGFLIFSLSHIGLFVLFREFFWASVGEDYSFGPLGLNLLYEMRKDLLAYLGLTTALYSYRFILTRLQGEAKFLASADGADSSDEPEHYRQQFLVKMLNREFLVKVDQIEWVRSASNYVLMNCGQRSYPMRQTLSRLAVQLDPNRFLRVHRTAIVNLDQVSELQEQGDLQLQLLSGATVPVSKTYLPQLKTALGRDTQARV